MYDFGEGVTKNLSKAAYWFEKAALQGPVGAQFMLASMYYYGGGVKKDHSKAAYWFEKAALQDQPDAQYNLAMMYETKERE